MSIFAQRDYIPGRYDVIVVRAGTDEVLERASDVGDQDCLRVMKKARDTVAYYGVEVEVAIRPVKRQAL